MQASFPFLIMMMLLGGGSGSDLLDMVPSDVYFKSKDVEVTTAGLLVDLNSLNAEDTSKPVAVRRLMAIRALGELKSADAVPVLKTHLASKEMFVAEYAQRAIDQIEGKQPAARSVGLPAERMKADLNMLPEGCGAVGQVRMMPGSGLDMAKVVIGAKQDAANGEQPDAAQADMMAAAMIQVAESVGNARLEAATLGVSAEIGQNQGFVVLYVRGKWDAEAVKSSIQSGFNQTQTAGEVEFMSPSIGRVAAAVPSDDFFVIASAPGALPLEEIGTAIKSGKGKFDTAEDLNKLIATVDMNQQLWAAMIITESYKQAPMLIPFQTLTMVGKATDEGTKFEATGKGEDAEAVKTAVEQFTALVEEGRGELQRAGAHTPAVQPIVDFFNSIELKSDGTTATGTALMKKSAPAAPAPAAP